MTQTAGNYARVLYELAVPGQIVLDAAETFREAPELKRALTSPVVKVSQKHRVIEKIFPMEIQNFLKILSDHRRMGQIDQVFEAYHEYACEREGILIATMYYVTEPGKEQLEKIKEGLLRKYHKKEVELTLVKDPGLIGGFMLRIGNIETDWSMKGRLKQLEQILIRR